LWKSLDKNHQGYLDTKQAEEFFGTVHDYCRTTLKTEGIVFDPSLTREDVIASWISAFDTNKEDKISYEGFCLALKAVASACNPELREREEKELEKQHYIATASAESADAQVKHDKEKHSKDLEKVMKEEEDFLREVHSKDKEKEKEKDKEKEKIQKETLTPSSLRRVFAQNENPILTQTFEFHFWMPKEIEHHFSPAWQGAQTDLLRVRSCIPYEYSNLGLNVIVDGLPGAGLSTIMEKYCSTKETITDDHPLSCAECTRDLYNIGVLIPIKLYKYDPRAKPTDPYIKFSSGLLVKVDLWVFALDITKPLTEDLHHLVGNRIKLVTDFFKQMKLNPALLFIGSKLDDREIREFSYEEGRKWAERYGAMYTEMSGATGMFVVRGFNSALRAAVGHKEQRQLFANLH